MGWQAAHVRPKVVTIRPENSGREFSGLIARRTIRLNAILAAGQHLIERIDDISLVPFSKARGDG